MVTTLPQTALANKIYGLLSRGGFEYKDNLIKSTYLKDLAQKGIETIVDREHNKTLYHELAIHGLLSQINPKLINVANLCRPDGNGQTPLSYAIRYQELAQIPKKFLTRETLAIEVKGSSLLQIATWAGELNQIPLKSIDKDTLTKKDPDDETPLGSVMEMVDYISNKSGHHHYYSSPKIKENYKSLLPKLLKKMNIESLNNYKSIAKNAGLIDSLTLINNELTRQHVKALVSRNNFEIEI